ncbi:MAG TPA: hypothetical protein VGF99_18005 [Myxococcota bacterium]
MTKRFSDIARQILGRDPRGLDDPKTTTTMTTTPAVWRAFLRDVGGEEELLSAFQRFHTGHLDVVEGVVVFAEENQNVMVWGWRVDDAHLDDPPVFQLVSTDEGPDGPFAEDANLSDFIAATLVLQATWGGDIMPLLGSVERGHGMQAVLETEGLRVVATAGALTALLGDEVAATVVKDEHGETVIVGCAKEADFERIADALGADADFFEL